MTDTPMADETPHALDLRAILARIREAAGKATAGPWVPVPADLPDAWGVTDHGKGGKTIAQMVWDRDATHITTCDPTTMLALCAAVESVMEERERLRELLVEAGDSLDSYICANCDIEARIAAALKGPTHD
jgi:hypothetical protein